MDIDSFKPEWEELDHKVIEALTRQHQETPKELRCRRFQVDGEEWTSWTMLEHLYKKEPLRYPTQARGLFTTRQPNGQYTVKVRGYDKFFNLNEIEKTQWSSLERDTIGPYTVTSKENGCIIFIAAASPTELIATSKHMIPEPKDDRTRHGGVGYSWALKHLASVNQDPASLASWLYKHRVTLVTELCDDTFEQHIVPYTNQQKQGLYLHGINYNTTTLHTLSIDTVQNVARHFGFHPIHAHSLLDIAQLRHSADQTRHQAMNENESEGIVIRCRQLNNSADFFFKVKNKTYLLYREYREVTKALVLVEKDGTVAIKCMTRKLKVRFDKTLYYIQWLQDRVKDHPEWFYEYSNNKGIVAVRQAFERDWTDGHLVNTKPWNHMVERVAWTLD